MEVAEDRMYRSIPMNEEMAEDCNNNEKYFPASYRKYFKKH